MTNGVSKEAKGNTILGDLSNTCLIHILTFKAAFSNKTAEPGNSRAQAFAPTYLAAHVEFL